MEPRARSQAFTERLGRQEHLAVRRAERPSPRDVAIRTAGGRDVTALEPTAREDAFAGDELGAEHARVAIDPHLLIERVRHVDVLRRIDANVLTVRELEQERRDDDVAIDLDPRVTPRTRALGLRSTLLDRDLHCDLVTLEVADDSGQHDVLAFDERVLLVADAALRARGHSGAP